MGFMDTLMGSKAGVPQLQELQVETPGFFLNQFLNQREQLPGLVNLSNQFNLARQQQISELFPSFMPAFRRGFSTTQDLLGGRVGTPTATAINRATIGMPLGRGFGSAAQRGITPRDLGLTSVDLQQRGLKNLSGFMQTADYLNPSSAEKYLFSPQQLMERDDAVKQFNLGLTNQGIVSSAAAQQKKGLLPGILKAVGTMVGSAFGPMGGQIGGAAGQDIGALATAFGGGYAGENPFSSFMSTSPQTGAGGFGGGGLGSFNSGDMFYGLAGRIGDSIRGNDAYSDSLWKRGMGGMAASPPSKNLLGSMGF
jgi:hypothetical protein